MTVVYKLEFVRYDEDIISVISSNTRYFFDPSIANNVSAEWRKQSSRNEVFTEIITVE